MQCTGCRGYGVEACYGSGAATVLSACTLSQTTLPPKKFFNTEKCGMRYNHISPYLPAK